MENLRKLCDGLEEEGFGTGALTCSPPQLLSLKDDLSELCTDSHCHSLQARRTRPPGSRCGSSSTQSTATTNRGYNLDSFQVAGAEWADPTREPDGLVEATSDEERDARF